MNNAMISVAPDVLNRILALRLSETETFDQVLRRTLPLNGRQTPLAAARGASETQPANGTIVSYHLNGEFRGASDATDAMIDILTNLAQYDDNFFSKLAAKIRGRTRNHIAQSRSEVYPDRPDLMRYVKEIGPNWFIGCNIANREKEKILRAACEVMGIVFGRDLRVELPHA